MIELAKVNWKEDGITRKFINDNQDLLKHPEKMDALMLGDAVTYCKTIYNPFAEEIMRRSGHLEKFRETHDEKTRSKIFQSACRYHGFSMG